MVKTPVDIFNMALHRIGEGRVTSESSNNSAVVCSTFYSQVIDQVAVAYTWSSLRSRQVLTDISDDYVSDFTYNYQLPQSPYCLKAISIFDPVSGKSYDEEQSRIEGRMLLCDINPVGLIYTRRPATPEEFDPNFTEAVTLCLASKIAFRITEKRAIENSMLQQYLYVIEMAQMLDGEMSERFEPPEKMWSEIR